MWRKEPKNKNGNGKSNGSGSRSSAQSSLELESNGSGNTELSEDVKKENRILELFEAAKEGDAEKVDMLLTQGVSPNVTDAQGRTPLHWAMCLECKCAACSENAGSCLNVFLSFPETNVNIQDIEGFSPLHLAAESQLEMCCKYLIMRGANAYCCTKAGDQAIKIIATEIPDLMKRLLDHSIQVDVAEANSKKCVVKIDFRYILGAEKPGECPACPTEKYPRAMKACPKATNNELQLLRILLDSNKFVKNKIFTHPAVAIFLDQKWRRVRKQFLTRFVCYVIWLLMYTSYILYVYLIKCPNRFYMDMMGNEKHLQKPENNGQENEVNRVTNGTTNTLENKSREHVVTEAEAGCLAASEFGMPFLVLLVLTFIMGLNEIVKIAITPKLYFKSLLNILHWILIFMAVGTFYPTFSRQTISAAQYQIAAITIFLAWSLILSQIGKFPSVGQYMEVFGHVLRNFWQFLLTYVSLFVAFALAFCILFPGDKPYTIFPFAFLKVFVMMIGEMEYQEMFYSSEREEASGPLVGHVLYATFVIVVAIVLMNLLVGLTVSDIQGLQKEAELSRVSRQIMDMYHLESFFNAENVPQFIKRFCFKMTSVASDPLEEDELKERLHNLSKSHSEPLLKNKYCLTFRPHDSLDTSVPEKLKACALELAVKTQNEKKGICLKKKCFLPDYKLKKQDQLLTSNNPPEVNPFAALAPGRNDNAQISNF